MTDPTQQALESADSSIRLRAALAAGTSPNPQRIPALIARCAVEPDFFVRDMLTWALCRVPPARTVPRLLEQLESTIPQARSQALHTLSKIRDQSAWPAVTTMLHDVHDDVAVSAWRAAVVLVLNGAEPALAVDLAAELGRGDDEVQLSLSRALVALGPAAAPAIVGALPSADPVVRAHAEATARLGADPDSGFGWHLELAKRVSATGMVN